MHFCSSDFRFKLVKLYFERHAFRGIPRCAYSSMVYVLYVCLQQPTNSSTIVDSVKTKKRYKNTHKNNTEAALMTLYYTRDGQLRTT